MDTRAEHLQWCKDRALAYVEVDDNQQAFNSFMSDMSKHPETKDNPFLLMGLPMLMGGLLSTPDEMNNWINGFN